MTAPAFGSLEEVYKKVSFSFMIPTLVFLGVLYASVSARFLFFRLFKGTKHLHEHTIVGWGSWATILLALWLLAFLIAELIPFFSSREFYCNNNTGALLTRTSPFTHVVSVRFILRLHLLGRRLLPHARRR